MQYKDPSISPIPDGGQNETAPTDKILHHVRKQSKEALRGFTRSTRSVFSINKSKDDVSADPATTASLRMAESEDEGSDSDPMADTVATATTSRPGTPGKGKSTKSVVSGSGAVPNVAALPTIDSKVATTTSIGGATKNPLMLKHRKASVRKFKKEKATMEMQGISKSPRQRLPLKNHNSSPTEKTKHLARRQTAGSHVVALSGGGIPEKAETPRLRQSKSGKLVKGISSKNILLRHLDNRPPKT